MRVLIAPDKFAGTLTAVEAAQAIATGWARRAPQDSLDLVPMADGGPGFVDVLHASLGGDLLAVTVTGPAGDPVPGTVLLHEDAYAYRPGRSHAQAARRLQALCTEGRPVVARGDIDNQVGVSIEHLCQALQVVPEIRQVARNERCPGILLQHPRKRINKFGMRESFAFILIVLLEDWGALLKRIGRQPGGGVIGDVDVHGEF